MPYLYNLCNTEKVQKKCGKCFTRRYCSKECQKVDWTIHKKYCKKNAPIRPSTDGYNFWGVQLSTCVVAFGKMDNQWLDTKSYFLSYLHTWKEGVSFDSFSSNTMGGIQSLPLYFGVRYKLYLIMYWCTVLLSGEESSCMSSACFRTVQHKCGRLKSSHPSSNPLS